MEQKACSCYMKGLKIKCIQSDNTTALEMSIQSIIIDKLKKIITLICFINNITDAKLKDQSTNFHNPL